MVPPKKPSCLHAQPCVVRMLNDSLVWDLSLSTKFMIVKWFSTVRQFIRDLNSRGSISAALDTLALDNLSERRNEGWTDLLLEILPNDECHKFLSYSNDELINTRLTTAIFKSEPQKNLCKIVSLSQPLPALYSTWNENKSLNNTIKTYQC